jgi:hypothetical protein
MYSEHGLLALMRAVVLQVCQRFTVVSYCMPGSPHDEPTGDHPQQVAGPIGVHNPPVGDGVGFHFVFDDRFHKLVGHTNTIIRVLKEHRAISRSAERAIVPRLNEGQAFFFLSRNEMTMSDGLVKNHHLAAAEFTAGLDHPANAS